MLERDRAFFFIIWSKVQLRQSQQHNRVKYVMSYFGCVCHISVFSSGEG
jgi:hypothetical protein